VAPVGTSLCLGVRGEHLLQEDPGDGALGLDLTVGLVEELGHLRVVHGHQAGHRWTLPVAADGRDLKARLSVWVPRGACHFFDGATGQRLSLEEKSHG
jgi:hypothetical protein